MGRKSKRLREIEKRYNAEKAYNLDEAIEILQGCPPVKFNQSVEVTVKLGVDPRKSDQSVRGTVSLPNGTGKTIVVVAIVNSDKEEEALKAGAQIAGGKELCEKIRGGWTEFDAVVTSPDMMREVGKLGKVLGPRGLMPTPKAGTVTTDIVKAIEEIKAGKIEFKLDRHGVISSGVGKISFEVSKLKENIRSLISALLRAKPATAKGNYLRLAYLSSTMGPGIKLDLNGLHDES
jgi:large subunit ribosomal protein L1